jgi:hypothetical protein
VEENIDGIVPENRLILVYLVLVMHKNTIVWAKTPLCELGGTWDVEP